jgi:arylsulfatase A-like enzyme
VAQAPWTLPSTASVLTGLYPSAHGALGDGPQTLPGELTTLAEAAEAAGITTVGVTTNPLISRGTNFAQGFETFVELEIESGREDGEVVKTPAGAGAVNAAFVRWLARNREHRFLAYLHYMEPHDPYTPPPHLRPPPPAGIRPSLAAGRLDPWRQQLRSAEGLRLSDAELGHLRRLYDAEIRAWDEELGHLLERLDALDVRRSTVIVVTADHGEEFGEHGRLTHGFHLYDELIRVPLVVAGPGISGGRRVELQTMGIDVFPTVAALLGLAVPDGLPGRNALELTEARPAFAMTLSGRLPDGTGTEIVAIRTPAAKLVWAPERGAYQLFDLARDPREAANRWGDGAGGAAGLAEMLAAWRAQAPAAPRAAADPAFAERLRALGYVE